MSFERQIEEQLIDKLQGLKYEYRPDIRDRDGLVKNFREKFQALNRVQLGNSEFERLLDEIITPDVFTTSTLLLMSARTSPSERCASAFVLNCKTVPMVRDFNMPSSLYRRIHTSEPRSRFFRWIQPC